MKSIDSLTGDAKKPTEQGAQSSSSVPWSLYRPWQRWGFLTILFLVATSNYFDYFILSVLLDSIKQEFRVSDTMLGILSGSCFALIYAVSSIPIARWADRGNRHTVITLALAGWSTMTAACGLAQSFWQLALARFGVGVFEPGALPAAQSLIADYFPPEQRATAIAVLTNGGSAIGWLLGIGFGGYIAATQGWRVAFLWAGAVSLALAIVARFTLAEPRHRLGFVTANAQGESLAGTVSGLRRKRSYLFAVVGVSVYATFAYGVMTFLPSFMIRSFHASLLQVSVTWGSVMAVANIGGAVLGGWLTDRLSRRDIRWYAWVPAIAFTLGLPLYWVALSADTLWGFISIEFVAEWILSMGSAVVFCVVLAVCGSRRRALACALMYCSMVLFGGTFGPLLAGALSDALAADYGLESLRYSLCTLSAFLLPAAGAFYWAGRSLAQDLEN